MFLTQAWLTPCGSHTKKLILVRLADRADDDTGLSWPSVESISKECDLSERSVRQLLAELESDGLIQMERRGGRHLTNRYWIVKQNPARPAPFIAKGCTPFTESHDRKGASDDRKGAPRAPQPTGTHNEPKRGGNGAPRKFISELNAQIKAASDRITQLKDIDDPKFIPEIKELCRKRKEWRVEMLSL